MFVVFEGIDGSGKTTLSNLVAQRLRAGGLTVEHVREGGTFASSVTQAMRELGRDARNLALTPRAELMLYLTREVQLFDEVTRPALARADVVIADRFAATPEVLAIYGRRMPAAEVTPVIVAATAGVDPDLTILVDVDPRVARARRQASKLIAADVKPPSRKGLAGPALQRRLREGYLERAAREPDRWIVIDNTDAELEAMADALTEVVRTARSAGVVAARARMPALALPPALAATDVAAAREALLTWVERRAVREPGLAAYFLDGVPGPEFAERRGRLAERVPAVVAAGLKWLNDAASWQLRHQLAETAPADVARSIAGHATAHPDALPLLRALAARVPHAVGEALWGRDDDPAWQVRELLPLDAVMASLGGVHAARGWPLRERWFAEQRDRLEEPAVAALGCQAIAGLPDPRAWELRKQLRAAAPVAAIEATLGLVDDRAWKWRKRFLDRAPKTVMKSITGLDDPRAWALRDEVADTCEEATDSIVGLDDPRAWALRERTLDAWAATSLRSLGLLAPGDRGQALIAAALARHPADVSVWRQVAIRGTA